MTALASREVTDPRRGFWHVTWPALVGIAAAAGVALTYQLFVRRSLGSRWTPRRCRAPTSAIPARWRS